jgi:hypothetical protein
MAGGHATLGHISELASDRGALVEERQEARRSRAAAVQDSERVRAHNQERTLPAKPDCETSSRHGVWLRGAVPAHDNDDALCSRTNEICKWGVSDPLRAGPGAKKGAAQWGSLTPHLPPTAVATAASAAPRAAQNAAR